MYCSREYQASTRLVQTCSQAKTSGTKLPDIYRVQKSLNPNLRPEKQHAIAKQEKPEMLQMGQGRAKSKRRKPDPISQAINQPSNMLQESLIRLLSLSVYMLNKTGRAETK